MGIMPAATWDTIAHLKLDFCDVLHGCPTAEKLIVFSQCKLSLLADAVEKGKNEPIKIFACAPVETGFSEKIRSTPRKTFFNSIDPKRKSHELVSPLRIEWELDYLGLAVRQWVRLEDPT
jgi:hypothetical protein